MSKSCLEHGEADLYQLVRRGDAAALRDLLARAVERLARLVKRDFAALSFRDATDIATNAVEDALRRTPAVAGKRSSKPLSAVSQGGEYGKHCHEKFFPRTRVRFGLWFGLCAACLVCT